LIYSHTRKKLVSSRPKSSFSSMKTPNWRTEVSVCTSSAAGL
jgi:hypothetical protein